METWRDVVGFEGLYQVSDQGRVMSLDRVVVRRNGAAQKVRARELRPGRTRAGYLVVALAHGGHQKMIYVHHLVLAAFRGPRPTGQECRHLNGVEADCRLDNLVWGSHTENERDKCDHDTSNRGSRNGHAKLTPVAVRQIRAHRSAGHKLRDLGLQYGVSKETICGITKGRTWTHVV